MCSEDTPDDGLPFFDEEVFSAKEDDDVLCWLTLLVDEGAGVECDIGAKSEVGSIGCRSGTKAAGCGVVLEGDPPNVLHPKYAAADKPRKTTVTIKIFLPLPEPSASCSRKAAKDKPSETPAPYESLSSDLAGSTFFGSASLSGASSSFAGFISAGLTASFAGAGAAAADGRVEAARATAGASTGLSNLIFAASSPATSPEAEAAS